MKILDDVRDFFRGLSALWHWDDTQHIGSDAYVESRMPARARSGYGWRPQIGDIRDHQFVPPVLTAAAPLPKLVDLRPNCPPVYDQGAIGSCTGNSTVAAIQFDAIKQKLPTAAVVPSRLFAYYNGRQAEGTTGIDNGAFIRDVVKGVNKLGCPPESSWNYVASKVTKKPKAPVYEEALKHPAVSYAALKQDLATMKATLAGGFPFVFGFTVYASFESAVVARSGVVPMPGSKEAVVGGHAVLAVGYDDASQRFIVRNSWGNGWGQAGYFTMPYAYLSNSNLASDFWVIQLVK